MQVNLFVGTKLSEYHALEMSEVTLRFINKCATMKKQKTHYKIIVCFSMKIINNIMFLYYLPNNIPI